MCDANAVSISELKQDQQKLQDICLEQEEELKSLKAQLQHEEEENKLLMEEINKKTLSFKNIQMTGKQHFILDFQISIP